ncbi:MAG: ABC transporter permease [Desulfobulbaceae bacterium]|nr:ABC transporter permease [Desulfobulbaceae bacterium]
MKFTKLPAVIHKELLLLWRDRAGLLVLFVMPALLVVIITLVQENVLKSMGESNVQILFIDQDQHETGGELKKQLAAMDHVTLLESIDGVLVTREIGKDLISRGKYQFGVVVPKGFTASLQGNASRAVKTILEPNAVQPKAPVGQPDEIELLFDPAVQGGFRTTIATSLRRILFVLEMNEKLSLLADRIPEKISKAIGVSVDDLGGSFSLDLNALSKSTLSVNEKHAARNAYEVLPTSVQQNVPAWALFGMFFIVVPLAGTLLKERQEGTLARLRSIPVSFSTLIAGKICAYQLICFGQFLLIAAIGHYLLPALGTPVFEIGDQYGALALLVFCSSLAATGYGVLLGTVSRTFEQISMFGPISIVAAAAIGGVMVPVFVMPEFMRRLSVISPLNWGLEGFMDIFVRGGNVVDVLPEAGFFMAFFILVSSLSLFILRQKS